MTGGALDLLRLYHRAAADCDGIMMLVPIVDEKARPQRFGIGDLETMAAEAGARADTANVYFAPAVLRKDLGKGKRGESTDIVAQLGLVIDDDPDIGKPAVMPPIEPTAVVDTSPGNRHLHFVFSRPLPRAEAESLAELLHRKCGGDTGTGDIAHVWRVPDTLNHPTPTKIKRGRPKDPQPVRLAGGTMRSVDPTELRRALETMPDLKMRPAANGTAEPSRSREALLVGLPERLARMIETKVGDDRSKACFKTMCALFKHGLSAAEVEAVAEGAPFAEKYWSRGDLAKECGRAFTAWQADGGKAKTPRKRAATHPIEDFIAYLPEGKVIHRPSRALWVPKSVDRVALPPTRGTAFDWLAEHNAVDQMTWAPGEPEIIEGRLFDEGGWVKKGDARVFNLYRPPAEIRGNPAQAARWVEHVRFLYPSDAEHIFNWLAQRVQHPAVKINHALVLGGVQRIGKDSILVPIRAAVGEWNFKEIAAHRLLDRFNGWLKSVVLRVNEAHDMGELNRYQFYERIKGYTAAPPEVLSCDEKNVKAYSIPNVTGVVLTTNHKTDGMYLPADDHRHFVAWSDRTLDDFDDDYFGGLHRWFADGGSDHVAAWLDKRDLTEFDPKAPPPQTDAWWEIVLAGQSPEKTDLVDVIASLGNPDALTIGDIVARAHSVDGNIAAWLSDAKMRRQVPHRMEEAGYVAARNPYEREKGRWKIKGRNETVYAKKTLSTAQRIAAARQLAGLESQSP